MYKSLQQTGVGQKTAFGHGLGQLKATELKSLKASPDGSNSKDSASHQLLINWSPAPKTLFKTGLLSLLMIGLNLIAARPVFPPNLLLKASHR